MMAFIVNLYSSLFYVIFALLGPVLLPSHLGATSVAFPRKGLYIWISLFHRFSVCLNIRLSSLKKLLWWLLFFYINNFGLFEVFVWHSILSYILIYALFSFLVFWKTNYCESGKNWLIADMENYNARMHFAISHVL